MRCPARLILLIVWLSLSGCGEVVYRSDSLIIVRDESLSQTVCPLHQEEMQDRVVGEAGGFQDVPPNYAESLTSTFPNSHTRILGGCLVPHQQTLHLVKSCPQCALAEWRFWESRQKELAEIVKRNQAASSQPGPVVTPPVAAPAP